MKSLKTVINSLAGREDFLEITVTDIIQQMGIAANIKGFRYLRRAIILCIENTDMINSVTKLLYPTIAAEFNISVSCVSINISCAIKIIWEIGNEKVLRSYFSNTMGKTKGKPTNAEFIALISDTLRLRFKNLI